MCGIAGIFSKNPVPSTIIKDMTDAIKRRGPDDEGYIAVNTISGEVEVLTGNDSVISERRIDDFRGKANLYFGHRRLAIIDLSASAHQPMKNDDGTIWLVYNGEIYNYIELRDELRKKGYRFFSNSDTEVLLKSYEEWGENCVEKFNGMWAFVIYDRRKKILFGSRDRTGVKPFYYYIEPGLFIFSSEIKPIIKNPLVRSGINSKAVFYYLLFGYEDPEDGFFKGIHELPPAHSFVYDLSNFELKKFLYWRPETNTKMERFDERHFKEYVEETRRLIFDAISIRLRSDVPIGTCLSGGLDSSTVACFIHEINRDKRIEEVGERQRVFTAVFEGKEIDESRWAEKVVKKTGAEWHRVSPDSQELINDLEELMKAQEIPFASTSIYAQFRVMKLAKEKGVKVLLDGQGGDEIFAGYPHFYISFFLEMTKNFAIFYFLKEFLKIRNSPVDYKYLLKGILKSLGWRIAPRFLKARMREMAKIEAKCLKGDFLDSHRKDLGEYEEFLVFSLNSLSSKLIEKSLRSLLRYEDRNSMWFSVEARTPFSDDINLIELQVRIPSVYKIRNGWSKFLLRNAVRGILPNEIVWRRDKKGFLTPEKEWILDRWNYFEDIIFSEREFFDPEKVLKFKSQLLNEGSLWRFINIGLWKKVFFEELRRR